MLTSAQIEYIDRHFGVYDHDWRYYAEFHGEPFLLNDCLVYFDGSILNYCSFSLENCTQKIKQKDIVAALKDFPYAASVLGIRIWGRYEPLPAEIEVGGKKLIQAEDYGESPATDSILDVKAFSYEKRTAARLARNAATNKSLSASLVKVKHLSHEHIILMEQFFATHEVSLLHASFYLSMPSLIKNENVFLIESRNEGHLKGFVVISRINQITASTLIGFYENAKGSRAADSVFACLIAWAKSEGIERIHLGYSATDSLLAFKKKWGATLSGPTYCASRYAADGETAALIKKGGSPWRDRMYSRVMGTCR